MTKPDEVVRRFRDLQSALRAFDKGPLEFWIKKTCAQVELLFRRFSPFKPGDRVALTKTPEITGEKSWGWLGSKHFLVEGAVGVVVSIDADERGFSAMVQFDDESYIDHRTKAVCPVAEKDRHVYGFREQSLRVIAAT